DNTLLDKSLKLQTLTEAVTKQKASLAEYKTRTEEFVTELSQHDQNLVMEKVRDIEHKLLSLENSIQHKQTGYSVIEADLASIREEAEKYIEWLEKQEEITNLDCPVVH
ncbi:unnamed protein product, partial [Lymnaea stagnalis]